MNRIANNEIWVKLSTSRQQEKHGRLTERSLMEAHDGERGFKRAASKMNAGKSNNVKSNVNT